MPVFIMKTEEREVNFSPLFMSLCPLSALW